MKKILTIAGSDSSGGAGIQADIKTICAHKMYAMSVITALTAQNTQGVYGVLEATPEFLEKQLEAVFSDIMPDSVKIGMVSSTKLIEVIVKVLKKYQPKHLVVDPVMISTSGHKLLSDEAISLLVSDLLPMATVITPNLHEAEALTGEKITSEEEAILSAKKMWEHFKTGVLIKGGHLERSKDAVDVLYDGELHLYRLEKINNPNNHGTGCTLSSAIACNLAEGYPLDESIMRAKSYLHGALADGLNIGKGSGPVNHLYQLTNNVD